MAKKLTDNNLENTLSKFAIRAPISVDFLRDHIKALNEEIAEKNQEIKSLRSQLENKTEIATRQLINPDLSAAPLRVRG